MKQKFYDVYIAAPFFNPEQLERVEFIKKVLDAKGLTYYSPKDELVCPSNPTKEQAFKIFCENCVHVINSKYILAVTDGKDMGTIWEAGMAYGYSLGARISKPVIYFAETLGENAFNLMLAQSGVLVLRDRKELEELDFEDDNIEELILSGEKAYTGVIE